MLMSRISLAAAVMGYLAYGAKPELTGTVLNGKGAEWEEWTGEFDNALVEFFAPWCGHCKQLAPEYEKAAKMLHDEGLQIPLIAVDATEEENKASAEKYEIKGFPTLKWFTKGTPEEYDGPRQAEGIVDWIKQMTGPAVETEKAPTGEEALAVVFHGEDASVFEEVAKANRKKAQWFHVKGSETKITVTHKGEEPRESTATTQEEIEAFFNENTYPLFGELNGDTFGTYMEGGKGLVWYLGNFADKDAVAAGIEEVRPTYTGVGKQVGPDYNVAHVNTVEFGQVIENMFGIKEFPAIVVQSKAGGKQNFIMPKEDELTEENVVAYVNKVKAGEVTPHLKSEEVPEEPQSEPVKVIVGKTIETMAFTADKDVLLEIYAPWCGHCKKLEPEYLKVAKKVEKDGFSDILTIAKLDGTLNDSPVESLEWSGFPTMYYIKAGSSEPMKYDGGRDAKGIWKWIKKNHSKADDIKAAIEEKKAAKAAKEEKEAEAEKAVEAEPAEAKEEL